MHVCCPEGILPVGGGVVAHVVQNRRPGGHAFAEFIWEAVQRSLGQIKGLKTLKAESYGQPTRQSRCPPVIRRSYVWNQASQHFTALRNGEIDIGLTLETGALLGRDFYARKLAADKSVAFLPRGHRLASRKELRLAELRNESFLMGPDDHVPGARRQFIRICRRCGKFKPRLINVTAAEDVSSVLALVAKEDAVILGPAFLRRCKAPDAIVVPVADTGATWNLFLVWQRGKITEPLSTLLNALSYQA